MTLTVGSLCSGYEGLGLGLGQVLDTTTAWVSEVDPSACAILDARLPGVPNLGDLTALDWSSVEPVDVLTAGYPCQPFSTAGRRQGANDARHLWPFIADAVGVLRPRLVVLENVAGHLSLGFDSVLADLARLGYDARWTVVRASDVGACHRRARLFIVAHPTGDTGRLGNGDCLPTTDAQHTRRDERAQRRGPGQGSGVGRLLQLEGRGASDAPDADDAACNGQRSRPELGQGSSDAADAENIGRQPASRRDVPDWGAYGPAIARHAAALGRPAPHPVDGRGRLNPPFVEWMQMVERGWVCDVPGLSRSQYLKILGNGVVPPQAAYALRILLPSFLRAAA